MWYHEGYMWNVRGMEGEWDCTTHMGNSKNDIRTNLSATIRSDSLIERELTSPLFAVQCSTVLVQSCQLL